MPDTCLSATRCLDLVRSGCPALAPSRCDLTCPVDERPPAPCGVVVTSGGQGVTRTRHALGALPGQVTITYQMAIIPDRLDCWYRGVLVATTGGLVSGNGVLTWGYAPEPGGPDWCLVIVSAPAAGTGWSYSITCPG